MKWAIGLAMVFATSCATQNSSSEILELKKQIVEIEKIQGKQSAQIDELNNKVLLLSDRVSESPRQTEIKTPEAAKEQSVENKTAPLSVSAPPPGSGSLVLLYAQVENYAHKGMLAEMNHSIDLMLKGYKDSPLTNDAVFLAGDTYYERGQYGKAAEQFEKLYRTFPDGNKAVESLYAIGLCYKKLGKTSEAIEIFQSVVSTYPGSREAVKADKFLQSLSGGGT